MSLYFDKWIHRQIDYRIHTQPITLFFTLFGYKRCLMYPIMVNN